MRLAIKNTLIVLAIFLAAVAGIGVWLRYEFRLAATSLVGKTAKLISEEIGRAISSPTLEELIQGSPPTHGRLKQLVGDLTANSHIVESVTVVDRSGQVISSDDDREVGRSLVIPEVVFQREGTEAVKPRLWSGGGIYYLFIPVSKEDELLGYVRLSIKNRQIADLYDRVYGHFLIVVVAGLVGVAVLGLLLHFQLLRRSAALSQALEGVAKGKRARSPRGDEFSEVIETARQIGTRLSQAEERGSELQRRLEALMTGLDVGILLLTPERDLDFASKQAWELLGCRDLDELQQRWDEFRGVCDQLLVSSRSDSTATPHTDINVQRNGGPTRVRLELYALDREPSGGQLIAVKSRDTVEALEQELGLAAQMRGFARFYLAFVHELKQPLNAMQLNVELLMQSIAKKTDRDDDGISEEERRYVQIVNDEISRVDRQLQSLLSYVRPPSDATQTVDIRELLRELVALLKPVTARQQLTLESQLPDCPVSFTGNPDRLKQAMLNIAINAVEALSNGGCLTISLECKTDKLWICFADNGPGISRTVLNHIFDMDFSTKLGGTGIGLYVARSVIESHGGEIRVDSQVASGTRFEIILPYGTDMAS